MEWNYLVPFVMLSINSISFVFVSLAFLVSLMSLNRLAQFSVAFLSHSALGRLALQYLYLSHPKLLFLFQF
jgi:hypothetical protein